MIKPNRIAQADWDRVAESFPVDRVAARVAGGPPEPAEFWFQKLDDPYLQDGPHPIKAKVPTEASFTNLTGRKIGRLTVRGIVEGSVATKPGGKHKSTLWAVRCDCSRYTARRHNFLCKAMKHAWLMERAMCAECDYAEQAKLGKKPTLVERSAPRRKHA